MKYLMIIVAAVCLSGCIADRAGGDPIVHPTDEQIENSDGVESTDDVPYVPWWAEGRR